MKENNVVELSGRVEAADALTAMLRAGAQALVRQTVDAELQALLASHAARVTDAGRAAVVRNGYLPERQLQTGIGPVTGYWGKGTSGSWDGGAAGGFLLYPIRRTPTCYSKSIQSNPMK